jgi:RND family efflux transporter MFP subunit
MKRRIVWINLGLALVLVAAGVGVYFWLFAPKTEVATGGRLVSVQSGTVSETVTASGTVETAGILELSFPSGGIVDAVKVSEGDRVKKGKKLVTLDSTSAKQSVANAQSTYVQVLNDRDHTAVSVDQAQLSVSQAQQAVEDAKKTATINKESYRQAIDNAKVTLTDAQTKWADTCLDPNGTCPNADAWTQLRSAESDVTNAQTAYTQAVQSASDSETTNTLKVNQAAVSLRTAEAKQSNDCSAYGSSSSQCASAKDGVLNAQQQLELAQNNQTVARNQGQQSLVNADAKVTQANLNLKKLQTSLAKTAKDAITAARESLASAELNQTKGLTSDQQTVDKAKQSLATSKLSVESVTTGSGASSSSQAQLAAARAGVKTAEAALEQTVITAPVPGRVAAVDATEGSPAAAGATVVTLIPRDQYQVTASFSEADALKLKAGQTATITFDALPNEEATGVVSSIDIVPTTSTTSTVTTYGATISLEDAPDGLKEGMTASVVVTTNEVTDVLWAPSAAVTTAGGQSTVTVRKDGVDTTVQVVTGLAGDSGTELSSGVAAGDQLVVSTTTTGTSGFPFGGPPGGGVSIGGGGGPPAGGRG